MQFLLGSLTMAVFFICVLLAYRAGQRGKTQPAKASEEDKRKAEEMQKHFVALFNYDTKTALQRKKVT